MIEVLSVDVLRFLNYISPFDGCVVLVVGCVRCYLDDCCSLCSQWTYRGF